MKAITFNLLAWVMLPIMDGFAKYLSADLPVLQITWARYFFTVAFTFPIMFFFYRNQLRWTDKPKLQFTRGLILFFNLEGFAAGVLLIQCSMPSAVLNYLVASIYSPKKIVDSVASTIVVSTLMSFITIPIVVFFALKYFN